MERGGLGTERGGLGMEREGLGMERGGSGRVGHMEFQKWNQGLRIEWICSKGLGMNLGQVEVGIRVLVWCYMECNSIPPLDRPPRDLT